MFSKRHYETIALALQAVSPLEIIPRTDKVEEWRGAVDLWRDVCSTLADTFARDNGAFNRDRFLRACVPGANVRARS